MNVIDNRYYRNLKMQLDFLNRSCLSYDQGFQDESFRIAVVLRVLFHNTKKSTSLLHHLQCEYIPLLSTKAYTAKEFIESAGVYMGLIQIRAEGLVPKLGTVNRPGFAG